MFDRTEYTLDAAETLTNSARNIHCTRLSYEQLCTMVPMKRCNFATSKYDLGCITHATIAHVKYFKIMTRYYGTRCNKQTNCDHMNKYRAGNQIYRVLDTNRRFEHCRSAVRHWGGAMVSHYSIDTLMTWKMTQFANDMLFQVLQLIVLVRCRGLTIHPLYVS